VAQNQSGCEWLRIPTRSQTDNSNAGQSPEGGVGRARLTARPRGVGHLRLTPPLASLRPPAHSTTAALFMVYGLGREAPLRETNRSNGPTAHHPGLPGTMRNRKWKNFQLELDGA